MNEKNHSEIGTAMNFDLKQELVGYIAQNLSRHFGVNNWWQRGVLNFLYDDQKRNLPLNGSYAELTDKLDIQLCLLLIDIHWREIFSANLPRNYLNYVKELKTTRNLWAHNPEAFDDATTMRALDTMARISEPFDEDLTEKLRAMWRAKIPKEKSSVVEPEKILSPTKNLKSWRYVIEPHKDVASGRYKQAEFAADLGQVVRGEGSSEYKDAVEFFSRTYLTGGLKTLLVKTLQRLTYGTSEPVIQLKTSFGGGKTHSLLALYHLFGGKISAEQSSVVTEILNAAEISKLPKVHTAVIVGTWENPLKSTLWGEIAAQLSLSTGKPELYEMMRDNDLNGVSPGVDLLRKLFDTAGACLILIDEVVAYGRKLSAGKIKSAGTFGNLMSFLQELTEAAKASRNTAIVVAIPESDAEIVDDLGRQVLVQVEKYFGRMEFVWSPITITEGYEIVRRRLFKPCSDEIARSEVCTAFFNMYVENENDFPFESRQDKFREKLLSCYPIHPKLFDYLYDKWTSLEKFQKTRGVLRLMANVIYHLWTNNDESKLIMPSSIPLNFPPVRDELVKLLGGNWDAIINAEIDGARSKPQELDSQNVRFNNLMAARKIARSIFMGTAPGNKKGNVRGILESEIRLDVIQPDEVDKIPIYNDAISKLKSNLYYLYSQDTRLWFSVNPTLRKLVDDKRGQYSDEDVFFEIENWLKNWRRAGVFENVHICPKSSADVPDEQTARLVILLPKYTYSEQGNSSAIEMAKNILENRGTIPRRWRNMLLFMVADEENLQILKNMVRDYLAWSAVLKESRYHNLDILQKDDADNNLKLAKENFSMKLSQTYCRLLVPETYGDANLNFPLRVEKIDCTKDNVAVASEKFLHDSIPMLHCSLGCGILKNLLDKFIWRDRDAVQLKQLWEYFATYYYLPRLINEKILLNTVRKGVAAKTFAVAEDFQDGKYIDLHFGDLSCEKLLPEYFLVKAEIAQSQLGLETPEPKIIDEHKKLFPINPDKISPPEKTNPLSKKFFMDVELDKEKYVRNVKNYIDEVASLMMNLPNAETSIRLVVEIYVPQGISEQTKDIVIDNCRILKIETKNFKFSS